MYLCRDLLDMTLSAIGEAFGGRDHSTVVNALDRLQTAMRSSPGLVERIDHAHRLVRRRETPERSRQSQQVGLSARETSTDV
jgi:hypothetical protein